MSRFAFQDILINILWFQLRPKPSATFAIMKKMKKNTQGMWIAIGVAIGAGLGVALDNIAVGLAIGIAIGVVFNASQNKK